MVSTHAQDNNDGNDVNNGNGGNEFPKNVANSHNGALVKCGSQISILVNVVTQGSIPMMHMPMRIPCSTTQRMEKFNGLNFKKWQ